MSASLSLFKREIVIAWRTRGQTAAHVVFVLLLITLFPFAIGPEEQLLHRLAPGLMLLAVLLGQMLGFEKLFIVDYQNGVLDTLPHSRLSLSAYAFIKSIAQWCALLLPVILCSPLLLLLLHTSIDEIPRLILTLTIASFVIQCLGMLGSALALGAKSAGLLLPLLLIPFYIPVMIFAVSFGQLGFNGEGLQAFYFLSALLLLYLSTLPFLSGAALRSAIEAS